MLSLCHHSKELEVLTALVLSLGRVRSGKGIRNLLIQMKATPCPPLARARQ